MTKWVAYCSVIHQVSLSDRKVISGGELSNKR
jgi:hypothetical protein